MSGELIPAAICDEVIESKILLIRGQKVMLDRDLANLYRVSAKRLNEQVKRNIKRFPEDFVFRLVRNELDQVVAICDHLKILKFSPYLPYAFTEHGILMLSSVLNSQRAIDVNIAIMRVFVRMKKMFITQKDIVVTQKEILRKLADLEKKTNVNAEDIQAVFRLVDSLLTPSPKLRRKIGFHQ